MGRVILGLDLAEIRLDKFKASNMWGNEFPRRRSRFVFYQLAMIFCSISNTLAMSVLWGELWPPNLHLQQANGLQFRLHRSAEWPAWR